MKGLITILAVLVSAGCTTNTATYTPVLPEERGGPAIPQRTPGNWQKLSPDGAKASYDELLKQYTNIPLDHPPRVLKMVLPDYPAAQIRRGIWGDVEIGIVVNEAGLVEEATVLKAPDETLARVTIAAIKSWRFAPATMNGKPTKVRYMQSFPFRLPQK